MKIDHEIFSAVILFPSAESFKKGCCQLSERMCTICWLTTCSSLSRKKSGKVNSPSSVDCDVKQQNKQTKTKKLFPAIPWLSS